jgi:hypothetical protein
MADAENDVAIGEWFLQKRLECGGVGLKADAEIDVRRNDAQKRGVLWRGGRIVGRVGRENVAKEGEGASGIRRIADRMLLGGESAHGIFFTYGFGRKSSSFLMKSSRLVKA